MEREIEYSAVNGSIAVVTEPDQTWIRFYVSGGMFGVMDNNAETRRFLRTALRRMEHEAVRDGR